MTSPHTLPITRPPRSDTAHEHGWLTESQHSTSEGLLLYVRCAGCGIRRVDLRAHPAGPPSAASREIGTDDSRDRHP